MLDAASRERGVAYPRKNDGLAHRRRGTDGVAQAVACGSETVQFDLLLLRWTEIWGSWDYTPDVWWGTEYMDSHDRGQARIRVAKRRVGSVQSLIQS